MSKSLRDRAFVLRMEPSFTVSTLRASIAFATLLLAGCESRVIWGSCTRLATGESFTAEWDNWLGGEWIYRDRNGVLQVVDRKNSAQFRCVRAS
jgi:hypothetical protein